VYCGGDALFDLVTYTTTITTSFSKPQLSLDSFKEEDMMKILSQLCQWQISYTVVSSEIAFHVMSSRLYIIL